MKAQQFGRVINISSSAGRMVSTLGGAHYTASKAGLLGLTRAAAKELGAFGITVNAICPGMIDTELTHEHAAPELLGRLLGPAELTQHQPQMAMRACEFPPKVEPGGKAFKDAEDLPGPRHR